MGEQEKRELDLYAYNTSELYGQHQSIIANLKRRIEKGTYDPALAPKLWGYWVEAAAKRYAKEFGGSWHAMFDKPTRDALAREIAVDEHRKIVDGEYGPVNVAGAMRVHEEAGRYVPKYSPLKWRKESAPGLDAAWYVESIHGGGYWIIRKEERSVRSPSGRAVSFVYSVDHQRKGGGFEHLGSGRDLQSAKDIAQKREDEKAYVVRENPAPLTRTLYLYQVRIRGLFRDQWAENPEQAAKQALENERAHGRDASGFYSVSKVLNVAPRVVQVNPMGSGATWGPGVTDVAGNSIAGSSVAYVIPPGVAAVSKSETVPVSWVDASGAPQTTTLTLTVA